MNKRPTIKMIAELAGVSRGTVDRVLHGRPNVSAENKERVLQAAEELNYTPNPIARALVLKDQNIQIAMILPSWTGVFETEVLRGIKAARTDLVDYGLGVIVKTCKTEDPEECITLIDEAIEEGARGVAVCAKNSVSLREKLRSLVEDEIPVVTFNTDIPNSGRICFVGQDLIRSGRIAAEIMSKLAPKGSKVLALCGNMEFEGHKDRIVGFSERYKEIDRENDLLDVMQTYNDYEITYQHIYDSLTSNDSIAGIYMANESVPACTEAVKRAGKKNKVHVLCHDLSEYSSKYLEDGSVDFVVEQNLYRQGYMPISILANLLIANKEPENEIEYTRIHIASSQNMD